MKQFLLVILFAVLLSINVQANGDEDGSAAAQINLQKKKKSNNHFDLPVPAVEPIVYYDADNQEIIIVGTGNLSCYDVEIESLTTWNVLISTQVDGTYDTIDVSSLPSDDYVITIDTSVGITYEGYFTVY